MNILLITPLYSTHYDAGWYWLRALNQLGHSIVIWDYRLDPAPPPTTRYPDITIVLKGENIDPRKLPSSPRFCYWPDDLGRTPGIEEILKHYDKAFTPVIPTPDWMEWLPSGFDPSIHVDMKVERTIPTVYIGTANSNYKVKTICSIAPMVFGNEWSDYSELRNLVGEPAYLHEFVAIANQAKVLIDVHQSPTVGLNRKFFELIPCGFTLTDQVPGVGEILGDIANEVSFSSSEEAREKIKFFLDHPERKEMLWKVEREKIKPYTYQKAVEKVLSYVISR